jgi:hypothetical protein
MTTHRLFRLVNLNISTHCDVPEILSEREVRTLHDKSMRSSKGQLQCTGHNGEDKQWRQSQRAMKQIEVKNITLLSDGQTFTKNVTAKQLPNN